MKIKKLHINRMPGFPRGLKGFDKLAGNVNVVAGPNGSGKSSTARVIQKLIWWNPKTTGYQVDAEINVQGESNRIEIDSQSYTRTDSRKRTHEDFSYISPAEFSNQYMLALHDLVKDNDNNLATIIAREVNGGVDLKQAGEKLGYRHNQPNTGHPSYKEYDAANKSYAENEKKQAEIIIEENNISALEEEKKHSEEALRLKDWYEKTFHYIQSRESVEAIHARIEQFPSSLAKMKEDDFKTVEVLEQRIREIDLSLTESTSIQETNREIISKLRIPHDQNIPDEQFHELTERIGNLKELTQNISACEREIGKHQLVITQTEKYISPDQELAGLHELNLDQVRNLSEFIRTANETAGSHNLLMDRKMQLETERSILKNKRIYPTLTQKDIITSVGILSGWLKTNISETTNRSQMVWLSLIWGIIAVLLGFYAGITGIFIVILLSICIIPFVLKLKKRTTQQPPENNKLSERLSLPTVWDSDTITLKIQELLDELEIHIQENNLEERINQISFDIEKSQSKLNEIHSRYEKYKESMGILPEKLQQLTDNYNSFYVFLCHIINWQEAILEKEKLENEKQTYTDYTQQQLDEINRLFHTVGYQAVSNYEQASAYLQSLLKEKEILKNARNEITAQDKIKILRQQERTGCQESLHEIYNRLEILPGQKDEILLLNNQYVNYIKIREQLNQEQGILNANFKLLQNHSLYEDFNNSLSALTADEIQLKIKELESQAERQNELLQRLADIRAQVKEKKTRNDIEIALSRKEEALSGLNGLLKATIKSMTGGTIISRLHEEISLNNENQVFKQANKILGSITKGRYNLILSEGLQPTFLALDNIMNRVQTLTEISTGTRVQLLLAIRLAYIESQENAVKLPILADELLANSDDERSEAIIRSLIEISRNRQLFYFTAQADEIEKWKHYLQANPELDSEIILLNNKMIEYDKNAPAISPLMLLQEVCSPTGFDHQSYRKQISVPTFDILEQEVSEMHLWYLMEDINLLYTCLQHGFYQWGQLNNFRENAGHLPGLDEDAWKNLKNKVLIFNRFKEMYSVGRSRKINREILVQSAAISDIYIDKMTELLQTIDHDTEKFLQSLDAGVIKGFRANKKEELRNYLLENNYISASSPYNEEDIRIKISALISNIDMDRSEAERFINRFLDVH